MYAIVFAAACALIWGASDFCGGKASQRAHPLSVTVISQILGLPMIALMVVIIPGTPRGSDLLWGAAAGVLGLFGIVLLYRGLSQGAMAVVAPTTAVTSAIVPILGGLLQGERPGPAALAGALCAVAAIGLVSLAPSRPGEPAKVSVTTVGLALLAGACFGGFFIILGFAGEGAGMWPMLGVRASSLAVGLLLVWRAGARLRVTGRTTILLMALAGLGDTLANGFYLLAVQRGDLSVIAPIAALYPASTVLLALFVEKERMRPLQFAGLGLAALALVLTAT
ncbi:MAG: DMT family transporter [Hamadaea sp.]|uniref:DMT family transporter n=1 Tax=Hamadaea sp. TaxID=2024425 RepID=UPI0017D145AE|nr:DMT family transporter [Hamadaea sp.]NUT17989.1 DMT family transporter [Hamadaea sp.]